MNAVLAMVSILPTVSLAAEGQFLRGDVNDDGRVTLADSYFLQRFLFAEGASPEEVCARSFRVLASAGVRHFYISNLPLGRAASTLRRIMSLASAAA